MTDNGKERLKELINESLRATDRRVLSDKDFEENLLKHLDSMVLVAVVVLIEDEFGIVVEDEEITPKTFGSIEAIRELVEAKRSTA